MTRDLTNIDTTSSNKLARSFKDDLHLVLLIPIA
jgi:hypothetical protein